MKILRPSICVHFLFCTRLLSFKNSTGRKIDKNCATLEKGKKYAHITYFHIGGIACEREREKSFAPAARLLSSCLNRIFK